jgi:phage shock protein B
MHSVFIAVIVFGGLILALAVIGSTILMGLKIIRGGAISKGQKIETDETKMIQEIYQGLSDMEERLEALETILLDREKDRKGKQA